MDQYETNIPGGAEISSKRYCLITPCRDEAEYARQTLEAVCKQTCLPTLWVIVDDGSTDATPQILDEYAARFPFIRVVRNNDRGFRNVGPGVVRAFYAGVDAISHAEWESFEYICKFDLDLDIPATYFEEMMRRMDADPRLATCSGKPYFRSSGKLVSEACGDEMSVGMIKFYRRKVWEEIGGFVPEVMWDGIDCHRCRMLGWHARSWDDPEIRFIHLRPMGSSQTSWWTGRTRHGAGQWFMGTGPTYMLASALYRLTRPPIVVGGIGMIWGYLRAMLTGQPRYGDLEFRSFVRKYQNDCLRLGKARATAALDERALSTWKFGAHNARWMKPNRDEA